MTDLHAPVVTMLATAILGLLFALLSVLVVTTRTTTKIDLGTDEPAAASPLYVAVRSHGNFSEYVPLTLLLVGLIEIHTGATLLVKVLAFGLVFARVIHPLGMRMKAPNPFRAGGFVLTVLILAVASIKAIMLSLG
ncbi:MAG: MAPEG family protein [Rhodospirillales bacterium]